MARPSPLAVVPAAPSRGARLAGVDGLRAFAALWVLAFHIRAFSGARVPVIDLFVRSGSTGVSLFLVLSGFCLFAPYAGDRLDRFRTREFLRRRCRRLLPAYYTSLGLVLLATAWSAGRFGLPGMSGRQLAGQAVTHLTLTHQLFPMTFYGLNGAYWSLGLEWELYLTLPLLVLAARRFGVGRTVVVVTGACIGYRLALATVVSAGVVPADTAVASVVLPNTFLGRWSEFALGVLAAELYQRGRIGAWLRPVAPVAVVCGVAGPLLAGNPFAHVLFGVVFFTLLSAVLAGGNLIATIFSWRPLVALGVMSYSLYLVHQPIVEIVAAGLHANLGLRPGQVLVVLILIVPVIVGIAWVLFVTVERRTLTSQPSRQGPVAQVPPPDDASHPAQHNARVGTELADTP